MQKQEYIEKVKKRYPYMDNSDIEDIYETAKRELFITLYSSNTSVINEETQIPYIYEYSVLECMLEIVNMGTMRNFTSYQENGVRWTRPNTGYQAYSKIRSKVGVM